MTEEQIARLRQCARWLKNVQAELETLSGELEDELASLTPGSDAALPLEERCDALLTAQELLADAIDACGEAGAQ